MERRVCLSVTVEGSVERRVCLSVTACGGECGEESALV